MSVAKRKILSKPVEATKLWIGYGSEDGWLKIGPANWIVDRTVDLHSHPWPIGDESVEAVHAPFYFHRLALSGRHAFIDELWRILKAGGEAKLIVPYYTSIRAYSDPLAHWPPVTEASFEWYRKAWRDSENMQHDLPLSCDFHVGFGHMPQGDYIAGRNEQFVQDKTAHDWNAIADLHVLLKKPA